MKELIITPLGTVSPYCYKNKNCSGFKINYNNQIYLIDAGNGISKNMNFPNDLEDLKIIISHLHPDHYGDLSVICQAALVYKRYGLLNNNIDIYIPKIDQEKDRKVLIDYNYIHSFENIYPVNIIDYDNLNLANDNVEITSIKVPHNITSNAIKFDTDIGKIVYSGDTGTKNNLRDFAKYADLLICESTFLQGQVRLNNTHLYASDAGKIARDAKVDKLLLTHFWPHINKNIYVNEAKAYFCNTDYAEEEKRLVLKK